MSNSKISINEIVDCTRNGILESHTQYATWSGGEWLWNAPEYLLTVKIAEKIASINKTNFVTLEDNVDYILSEANAKGKGKVSNNTRSNGRFDIVVWWAKGTPRAIIEVKNGVNGYIKIQQDVKRINDVLRRKIHNSELQFGLIAFYISYSYKADADQKLQNKIDNIFNSVKEDIHDTLVVKKHQSEIIVENKTEAYASVVILFKRQSNSY